MIKATPQLDWLKTQIALFQSERTRYEDYTRFLRAVLKLAADRLFPGALVEARSKAPESFAEKCLRKAGKYDKPVYQLTDLCGARVVAFSQSQVDAMCEFIKVHFDIDAANSEDKLDILHRNEFGYRSVHFVVQVRPEETYGFDLTPEMKAWETGLNAAGPDGKPIRRKAEIQVRTHLQHVWSDVFHDRLYKGGLKVPARYERATYAISAQMEPIDDKIVDLMARIDAYREEGGASLDRENALREIEIVATLMAQPGGSNPALAQRSARLYRMLSRWSDIVPLLAPYLETSGPEGESIRVDYAHALCRMQDQDTLSVKFREGVDLLRTAADKPLDRVLMPRETRTELKARTLACLAWALDRQGPTSAEESRRRYREAYQTAPANPHHFRRFVEAEVKHRRDAGFLSEMALLVDGAVDTCKEQIQVGVSIPQAHYTQAVLQLLTAPANAGSTPGAGALPNRAGEGLYALTRMATQDPGRYIEDALDSLWQLRQALANASAGNIPSLTLDLLDDAVATLVATLGSVQIQRGKNLNGLLIGGVTFSSWVERVRSVWEHDPKGILPDTPVVWVAGSAASLAEGMQQEFAAYLTEALNGFRGLVLGGGSRMGIPGALGEANLTLKQRGDKHFRLLGLLPEFTPDSIETDERYDALHRLRGGRDFTFREIAHTWILLLRSGIHPSKVRILGLGGGPIAGFEYRMGLAMGATVGVLEGSGGAGEAMRKESPWWADRMVGEGKSGVTIKRLVSLPRDPAVVCAFLQSEVVQEIPDDRDLAVHIHANYVTKERERNSKISPVETWEHLPREFQLSNYHQAGYAASILRRVGFQVAVKGETQAGMPGLTDAQVEVMAKLEHGRWIVERLQQGWVYGKKRDNASKIHPDLVPWEKLSEDSKDRDREAVREFPSLLTQAGFAVIAPKQIPT